MNHRNNDISISGTPHRYHRSCLGVLLFYFCHAGLVWITIFSASVTVTSASPESISAASTTIETANDERKSVAAKRFIRASLWMEAHEGKELRGLDSDLELQNDLAIVLGSSFDSHEIESMVRDVRNELRVEIPEGTENATHSKQTSTATETCVSSALPTPSASAGNRASVSEEDDTDDDGDNDADDAYDSRRTGDRHASGLLETVRDRDCLDGEFDVQNYDDDEDFDIEDAIDVLRRCRILVLRNVFSKETTSRILPRYIEYIQNVGSGKISSEGTTTFGGDYFILKEDDSRFNYMATKELVEQSTGLLDNEVLLKILSHPTILGDSVIVNHVGTIDAKPGAGAQYWHADGDYVASDNDDIDHNGYTGVAGHDLPPFAINMFTPLLPREGMGLEHGPTEFCLGTSHLKGHDLEEDLPLRKEALRTAQGGIVEHLQEFEWYIAEGRPPPPHVDCPGHLHRIPLLKEGDAVLFDYMLTHRGGANRSGSGSSRNSNSNGGNTTPTPKSNRSMVFATYSRKWFRDTNFDSDFGHQYERDGRPPTPLEELTRLTRFAVVEHEHEHDTGE